LVRTASAFIGNCFDACRRAIVALKKSNIS
jgi:hypothetical protein